MYGEVAVTDVKPDGLGEFSHCLQTIEGIAFYTPSALAAKKASQSVGDGIQIGGNVQTPPLEIVAGVHHEGEILRWRYLAETIHELRSASAAGENDDHAALRA